MGCTVRGEGRAKVEVQHPALGCLQRQCGFSNFSPSVCPMGERAQVSEDEGYLTGKEIAALKGRR
jgi:hypothetical protein